MLISGATNNPTHKTLRAINVEAKPIIKPRCSEVTCDSNKAIPAGIEKTWPIANKVSEM